MEALEGRREMLRDELNLSLEEVEELLKTDAVDHEVLMGRCNLIRNVYEQLTKADNEYLEWMVTKNLSKDERVAELKKITEIKMKVEVLKVRVSNVKLAPSSSGQEASSVNGENANMGPRLPKIEIKKFDGNFLEWLRFWAQFKEIDSNPNLTGSAKFTYLLMSLKEGSVAHQTVAAFPQDDANYSLAINALKRRFGDDDFLLQVYVRELLTLVISNANSKEKPPLTELFPKVDSHLRALKTLNLRSADPETWLYPLVESCLPEETLRAWQRSPLIKTDGSKENPPRTRLDLMMEFLENEVEITTRIDLARGGFSGVSSGGKRKADVSGESTKKFGSPRKKHASTVVNFQNSEDRRTFQRRPDQVGKKYVRQSWNKKFEKQKNNNWGKTGQPENRKKNTGQQMCVFCNGDGHAAQDCNAAKYLTLEARKNVVRDNHLCFKCLGSHYAHECPSEVQCRICGHRRHCTVLCEGYGKEKERENTDVALVTHNKSNQIRSSPVALLTLYAVLTHNGIKRRVRIFMDPGSQRSYIRREIATVMNMEQVGSEIVAHELFGGNVTKRISHSIYEINLRPLNDSHNYHCLMRVRDQDIISMTIPKLSHFTPEELEELKELGVSLTDVGMETDPIDVLIGADNFGKILTGCIKTLKNGQVAIQTKLGWGLLGERNTSFLETFGDTVRTSNFAVSDYSIAQLWDMDTIGVRDNTDTKSKREEEEEAKDLFLKSLSRDADGRYIVGLPWRTGHPPLPSNRQIAEKCLEKTTRKLQDLGLFSFYDNLFNEWTAEGFIEEVTDSGESGNTHYIPHRPVIKPESTSTPVRPVFNASCRAGKSPSLNDCLHKGNNLILMIPDILMRFREKKVGFVSDIRKAFQMIGVQESDRDAMSFLWWNEDGSARIFRHRRVMFGANCSPFILAAVLEHHLTHLDKHQDIGRSLLESMYVDNCVYSASTKEEYQNFRTIATNILKDCKMDLRLWMSSVDEFEDQTTHVTSVLGLKWDRINDVLFVKTCDVTAPEKITKRSVLSTCQKIFDPIGITSPAVIPIKLLLQKTWAMKISWDAELPDNVAAVFLKWMEEIKCLSQIQIPRRLTDLDGGTDNWSLYTFCDSSTSAYAAVTYLKVQNENGVSIRLVGARARIAPVKRMTIPRLELLGCLIAARLCNTIQTALRIEHVPTHFYTDSTTALAWIRRNEEWATFVGNRTKEINTLTKREDWNHIPGELNPADLPSRGCSPFQLLNSHWWEGPTWLYSSDGELCATKEVDEEEVRIEMRKSAPPEKTIAMSVLQLSCQGEKYSFSSWTRIMIYVRRFIHNARNPKSRRYGIFSLMEIREAEESIVREIQKECFGDWKNRRFPGLEVKMNDRGLLFVETRLLERKDLVCSTMPYILPGDHPLVKRMIMDLHFTFCHAGVGFLMTKIRQKYWIIRTRKSIYTVISKCLRCRKLNAKPFVPQTSTLPLDRIKDADVFEVCGVDLAGPFILRNGKKSWMVIITCAVFRAIYLDIVDSLSTTAFIKCLKRFIDKHGRPTIIYSDNGTNFRGCSNLFKRLDWKKIAEDGVQLQPIVWKFNPPGAPWWGGFWERLIRTIKDLLRRAVGKSLLSKMELEKTLKVIQEAMNDRPLTYVSEKSGDLQPLTPNSFLHPSRQFKFPEVDLVEGDRMRRRYEMMKKLWTDLKRRFQTEYLGMLVACARKKSSREPKVGELVVVSDDQKKRIEWPLGKIEELCAGRDGVVRVAKIRIRDGTEFDTKIITRAIQRLHPLELDRDVETHRMITRSKAMLK